MNADRILQLVLTGQVDKGRNALSSAPPADALDSWHDWAHLGAAWVKLGEPQRALPYLLRDWREAPAADAGLAGAVLLGLGHLPLALQALEHAVAGSSDPAHRVNYGRALCLVGQAEAAIPQLQQALDQLPAPQLLALQSLAEAYVALQRFDDALALLPEDASGEELVGGRARVLAAAGRHPEANRLLRQKLREKPDNVELLLLASELASTCGRPGEASALLRKALEHKPDDIQLWTQLVYLDRHGNANLKAEEAVAKVLELAQDAGPFAQAQAQAARGHHLMRQGELEQGQEAFEEALRLAPGFIPALSGLGNLLLERGQVEEAVRCFEQVRSAAPLQGWSQLIQARQLPDDPEVLQQMEQVARQPSLEGPLRSGLLFTLSAAHDRLGHKAQAMELAIEANEASKALLPYKPKAHRQRVARIIAQFDRAFLQARQDWGSPSRLPVFIVGMPRSGTTLTEQILAGHSAVHGAGELGQIGELITRLEAWEIKVGSGLHYPECLDDLTAHECQGHAERLLAELQSLNPEASRITDKLPHNFEHIGLLKLLFPNAAILHVRREPRDIAISNYFTDYAAKFGGMGFAYDLGWIGEQLVDHDRLMEHWHQEFPGQVLEVPYEELIEDTELWARRMLEHIGLEWEPQVVAFQDLERPVKTASVWQVRQPVYKTSRERWRAYAEQLAPLEQALETVPVPLEPRRKRLPEPGLLNRGIRALRSGQAEAAATSFRQLLAANRRHAASHHYLGVALLHRGELQQALRHLRVSVRIQPFHQSWHDNLAAAEMIQGNHEAMEQHRSRAEWLRTREAEAAANAAGLVAQAN